MKPSTFLLCLGTALLAAGSGRAADQPCGNNQTQSPSAPPSRNHPCNGDGANLFNAYTGNASREVVDLTVFGSVGELPLKMVRYSNTRLSAMAQSTGRFGKEGVWTHGYQWSMRDGGLYTNGQPVLRVGFPDGADVAYIQDVSDPTLWLPHANGTSRVTQSGTAFTLLRADGTVYRFNKYPYTTSGFYYRLDSCEDALGNVYAMQYNSVTDTSLRKVVDPSGRWLQFTYVNHGLLNQEKTVLHTTPYPGTAGSWVEATGISTAKAHRYLTLYYNNDWHNAPPLPVAEVEFYDENNVLITGGTPFGSEPVFATGEESAKAFDGNAATYYRYAYKRNGYVGVDLGVGVTKKVSRIRYLLASVAGSTPTASAQFVGMNSLSATHYSIKEVKASDGRKVVYNYSTFTDASGGFSWSLLDSATYPDATQALYGYTQVHLYTRPILSHAVDPRVPGAGSVITYGFDPDTSLGFVREERNGITNEVIATTSHDAAHQPKAVYSNGRTIKYSYTGSTANLTQKIDGMGGVSNFIYGNGGTGHLVSETDARGHTTTYTRTALGNPLVTTYPDGTVETITRDARERILTFTVTGPGLAARVTTNTRDGAGRITRKDHPDGTYETWTYNALGQVLTHTERDGGVATTTYSVNGVPQTYTDAEGGVRTYAHNSLDQLTAVTNANSHTTGYVQNDRGQTTRVTHPDASFISYAYDDHGNRIQMVNELGKVWTYGYDEYNRLTSVADPLSQLTHYSYVGAGGCGTCNTGDLATLVTLPSGRQIHSAYDLDWQLTSRTTGYGTADAATTSYVYDAAGNVTQVTDANGKVSLYTYDSRNRCLTSTDALSRQTTLVYDGEGNVLSMTRPDGGVTTAVYDLMDRQTSVTDPKSQTTGYTYDAAGRLKTMTDARGKVHTWSYDLAGRPTELLYPDATTEQWTYDDVGNRLTTKTRQGQVATATFDNRNREVTYDWSDSTPDVVRTYDVGGMLATSGNSHATSSYTYDDAGRKLTETQYVAALAQSYTVTYGYDADGNCTSVTYPGGSVVDYSYTARGQVKDIQADGPPPLASYTYHANGERATRSLENGTVTTYTIDDASQTTSVVQSNGGGVFQRYDYTYDAAGRRKTQLVNNATWDVYTFDAAGQVSGVTYEAVNATGSGGTRQVTYVHDAAGNRQSVTVAGSGSTLLPPVATGTTTYGTAIATNQYPTVGGSDAAL
ncbi:RHS repeat domain-containing protein [Verrucomicrobium sp. BvORR106]|uniref:RHS repeat domain-containing protein n=1 Tax=Verrucomicrobium sp. BvORR106 TaxID=1403819 RepID=UPI00056E77E4|nr:RHS repeat domain-containing protein [Verrucomicrobium sp. BvORR106]